jgi:hypothetical protein
MPIMQEGRIRPPVHTDQANRDGRRFTPAGFFSLDQPYHSAPLYSIKCMNDVVSIEYGQQPLHRSRWVTPRRLNVFP